MILLQIYRRKGGKVFNVGDGVGGRGGEGRRGLSLGERVVGQRTQSFFPILQNSYLRKIVYALLLKIL